MSPIRFRPKKEEDEEEETKKEKEEQEENSDKKSDDDKKEKKFQISSELETVEEEDKTEDFEVSDEKKISKNNFENIDKDIDNELNKKNFNNDSIELELIGKDENGSVVSDLYTGKNLIVVTLPDKSNFITSEENFENIKKHFSIPEDQFRITHNLKEQSIEVPSFLLRQADIKNGDPLFFKLNEENNTIEIKKKK
jgi:hypothetical protein